MIFEYKMNNAIKLRKFENYYRAIVQVRGQYMPVSKSNNVRVLQI